MHGDGAVLVIKVDKDVPLLFSQIWMGHGDRPGLRAHKHWCWPLPRLLQDRRGTAAIH